MISGAFYFAIGVLVGIVSSILISFLVVALMMINTPAAPDVPDDPYVKQYKILNEH